MIHVFTSLFGHTTKYITSKKHTTKRHSLINVLRRDTLKFSHCVYLHDAALRSTVVRSVLTLCIAGETDVAHTRPHLPHLYDVFFVAQAVLNSLSMSHGDRSVPARQHRLLLIH